MRTLAEYCHLVFELEHGRIPPGLGGKEVINKLIAEICAGLWRTPDERGQAQWLVLRLANLK
jgi:hypothetical protein